MKNAFLFGKKGVYLNAKSMVMEENGLVTLGRFSSAGEVAIYKSLLEANGIPVFVMGEYVNDVYPVGETWASIDIRVASENEEKAREILAAKYDPEEFRKESEESAGDDPESEISH